MPPTHISNLYALAKGLRAAFTHANMQNSNVITQVLQNNAHLLSYYHQSRAKDWEKLIKPNPEHYQKKWLSLDNVPLDMAPGEQLPFGIAVLTWLPGQMTDIHGHPEHGCIMMPLQGSLLEERFTLLNSLPSKYFPNYLKLQQRPSYSNILMPGKTAFINNTMGVHQVKNNGDTMAVSLHVYSPGPC